MLAGVASACAIAYFLISDDTKELRGECVEKISGFVDSLKEKTPDERTI